MIWTRHFPDDGFTGIELVIFIMVIIGVTKALLVSRRGRNFRQGKNVS